MWSRLFETDQMPLAVESPKCLWSAWGYYFDQAITLSFGSPCEGEPLEGKHKL